MRLVPQTDNFDDVDDDVFCQKDANLPRRYFENEARNWQTVKSGGFVAILSFC